MKDVKSAINLQDIEDARIWASEVMEKRPYRVDVFKAFSKHLKEIGANKILEIGSGPGFLAEHILKSDSEFKYTAFDFSEAMHTIAKERIGNGYDIKFVVGDFTKENWANDLEIFDAIVSIQAIHEVRHKSKVKNLFATLLLHLKPQGTFLYCDHVCDENGMANSELYMNEQEQLAALQEGGFTKIEKLLRIGSLAMWKIVK